MSQIKGSEIIQQKIKNITRQKLSSNIIEPTNHLFDQKTIEITRKLTVEEGLFLGPSSIT